MRTNEGIKVKVKRRHGMSHQGINQEVKRCKEDQEVGWIQCHMAGGNIGTTLKVENNGKSLSIKKLVKKLENNMVIAIKEDIKGVTTTMTKVAMEVEMLASTLSKLIFHHSKGNVIPMLI